MNSSDQMLIEQLSKINRELFQAHGVEGDQEIEGLETLTSAIDELEDELA